MTNRDFFLDMVFFTLLLAVIFALMCAGEMIQGPP